MTNEEMERGIEFLLKHQANFEARLSKTEAQLTQTSQQVETLAQTQVEFTKFVRSNLEALGEVAQSLRETVRSLTVAQSRTGERLNDLESGGGQG